MNDSIELQQEEQNTLQTEEVKSPKKSSSRLSTSSEGNVNLPENGSTIDENEKKSLRSAVITENDPLKIKLKISKRDIEPIKSKKENEGKSPRRQRNSIAGKSDLKNGDEKLLEVETEEKINEDSVEKKRKLRSKKESEESSDSARDENGGISEGVPEKKKKSLRLTEDGLNESSDGEKVVKKRGRPKVHSEDREEGTKRRSKRIETGEDTDEGKSEKANESKDKSDHVAVCPFCGIWSFDFDNCIRCKRKLPSSVKTIPLDRADNQTAVESKDEPGGESFCWTCHKDGSVVKCDTCPRVFHLKCVSLSKDPSKNWICPECSLVLHAETISTRSEAMKSLSLDQLCTLLGFAIERMKNVPESEAFWKPVDPKEVPLYDKYVTNPMDLNLLEKNMKARMYGSPQAFLADAKWLLHNSIIFNSTQSPLTSTARFLVKICRQEMAEIENCPDCYLNAHTKEDWFIEVCRKPHILIWARLKGFPFWPAKAMSTNLKTQQVDARFFGAHDKAWVPVKECYLYSKNSPQLINKKRGDLDDAFIEVEGYIRKIKQKFGTFVYAPDKTPFVPEIYDKQLQSMIPNCKDEKTGKKKKKLTEDKVEENGVVEKTVQNGKKVTEHGSQHRFKLKRPGSLTTKLKPPNITSTNTIVGDINLLNDYVSDEKVLLDDKISPEDEIARSLEKFNTYDKSEGDATDENSMDVYDDASGRIPEHGYSKVVENVGASTSTVVNEEEEEEEDEEEEEEEEEKEKVEKSLEIIEGNESKEEAVEESKEKTEEVVDKDNECSERITSEEEKKKEEEKEGKKGSDRKDDEPEQCEVSSTNAEMNEVNAESGEVDEVTSEEASSNSVSETEIPKRKNKRKSTETSEEIPEKKSSSEGSKPEEEKSAKSFTNLTVDQKQKIITEAKLLANIDEMTALGKQKILNELGLDASQVDIRQLAQENREILETLNKKGHSEDVSQQPVEEVPIKNEDFEQYLMEESNEENEVEEPTPERPPPRIKVRDFNTLSKNRSTTQAKNGEPMLKIMDMQSLKDLKSSKDNKLKRKKSTDESSNKKLKIEPVIELIKLDNYDKNVQKLNRKLRLSDEVSLLMVDGEKKTNIELDIDSDSNSNSNSNSSFKKLPSKPNEKPIRARKSLPNRTNISREKTSPKTVNVISVDTEISNAQKNLLKSLCLEEKRTSDKRNLSNDKKVKSNSELNKKQLKDVTIETVKDGSKSSEKDCQKNLTVVANSHLILTNNGPTFVTNQNNQPNLALTQNNLGQLSLVHLTNLTSGIQTNFVNLANETIGFNNSIGTLYATPSFNSEGFTTIPSTGTSSVLLTSSSSSSSPSPSLTTNAQGSTSGKSVKAVSETSKAQIRIGPKPTSGISVKSPASLGLVTPGSSNPPPPLLAKPGDEAIQTEIGSVSSELNRHSIKLAEYMRATIEDILRELSNQGSLEAKYKSLLIEMEKLQWRHQQEIMELKHHSERSMMELRTTLENEKQKCLAELRSQLEAQHQKVISETKHKQWCANCGKEALFYCCWNTSYCDYPCQQQHWPGHMSTCAQLGNNVQVNNQIQGKSPGMKYQTANYVPVMSRGGGSHSGGPFAANRAIPSVQSQAQIRRSNDSASQLPINITIRPQHYFM